ncbi:LGFP repeat-containing protein [Gordonia sp. (in: high G+C Gram-positive bacteria)]|uniref:LGFP repeat-containing protein n=1 Tax=Gordonia sp. (in: high G+C Gram-positive bacteria) TaxID=84139 RepID=UPI003C78D2E1
MTLTISHAKYREVDALARARDGLYYGYGEAFTRDPKRSTDCSGLVLQTGAWMVGRTDWVGNRYGSTESFRLDYKIVYDLGFRRMPKGGLSALPFKPIMLVGLQHGGGGIYSHTACTLFGMDKPGGEIKQSARGVDWESQGAGVFYYEGARAWNDPLFHDFWYLDAVLEQSAVVVNEIDAEAKRQTWLGARMTGGEIRLPDGVGRMVEFEHGWVYWHPTMLPKAKVGERAIAIPRPIFDVWARQGWEKGPVGYPSGRAVTLADGTRVQSFDRGTVYRPTGTSGAIVHGAILNRYAKAGFEQGWGYPVGNEGPTSDGGREQKFSKGVTAIWHPSGVVTVKEGK